MTVSVPNNVSKQSHEQDLQHHLKFNISHINSSNNSKPDVRQRNNNVKSVSSNDSWNYNDNNMDPFLNTKTVQVWKLVDGFVTGQGTPGYSIDTAVRKHTQYFLDI